MQYDDFVKIIQEKIAGIYDKNKKLNIVREELQKNILYSIYSRKNNIYFLGGTNLRICYNLDRFSEDLDFALDKPNMNYEIEIIINNIIDDLKNKKGFNMNIKIGKISNVRKAMIKFSDILYDTGISPLKDEKVTIKLEIDINPALGAKYGQQIMKSSIGTCMIKNQDINSTFAGKIGALLLREYFKGRDYYDIYWYLDNYSHKAFNLNYLSNIIKQYNINNDKNIEIPNTNKNVLNMILDKIDKTDYNQVKRDLIRFVTWDKGHLDIFFDNYKNTIFSMIQIYNKNLELDVNKTNFRL